MIQSGLSGRRARNFEIRGFGVVERLASQSTRGGWLEEKASLYYRMAAIGRYPAGVSSALRKGTGELQGAIEARRRRRQICGFSRHSRRRRWEAT